MIEVLAIPPLTTVQDLGRAGYWRQGLGSAGVMDTACHRLANMALGNPPDAATLEIPLTPARLRFATRQGFALAGAACGARLDGQALPRIFAGIAAAGQVLELGVMQAGARVYLALAGGSTCRFCWARAAPSCARGSAAFEGRVLRPGDRLRAIDDRLPLLPAAGLSLEVPDLHLPRDGLVEVRALPSTEHDTFSDAACAAFWSTPYEISAQSNRQGYRLSGPVLDRDADGELRSHGIVPGIVQVPGGGQPIIQLADSATMGGYPKIAAVIEADLWRIGQARPGDRLRFLRTDLAGAAHAAAEAAALWDRLAAQLADMAAQHRAWGG
jgi:5-oxoprolinase (ATP-hydrolysing) subunit C